jgi:hypothetical protein
MLNRKIALPEGIKLMLLVLTFLIIPLFSVFCQVPALPPSGEGDTLIIDYGETAIGDTLRHSPKKATIYSAVLPGLGQIYNKKYWKLPIIYVGFGTFAYFIDRNIRYYKDLRKGFLAFPEHNLKYFNNDLTKDQIERGKDIYKRYRDLSYITTAGFYVLQIIDATVDAYLFDWSVSEDISLRIEPSAVYTASMPDNSFGIRACLSF